MEILYSLLLSLTVAVLVVIPSLLEFGVSSRRTFSVSVVVSLVTFFTLSYIYNWSDVLLILL
ncbi:MAG: hypothetical protein KBC35_01465 [Candidatus Pacebacteria bacterium]|nr:hypothetical protein [Candidatus Paceibacterota bacterium]